MADLRSVAELCFRRLNPNVGDETSNLFAEYLETSKLYFANIIWEINRANKQVDGENNIPTELLRRGNVTVINNEANISHLNPIRINNTGWIQNLGTLACKGICKYTITDLNTYNKICGDGSKGDNEKFVVPMGNNLLFLDGIHNDKKEIDIIYAGNGSDIDGRIEIDDVVGAMVLERLTKYYQGKVEENKTNNTNSNG